MTAKEMTDEFSSLDLTMKEFILTMAQLLNDFQRLTHEQWCEQRGWDPVSLKKMVCEGIPEELAEDPRMTAFGGFLLGVTIAERRAAAAGVTVVGMATTQPRSETDGGPAT